MAVGWGSPEELTEGSVQRREREEGVLSERMQLWPDPATSAALTDRSVKKTEKITARKLVNLHTALRDVVVWLLQTIAVVGVATLPLECQVSPAYSYHGDDASVNT